MDEPSQQPNQATESPKSASQAQLQAKELTEKAAKLSNAEERESLLRRALDKEVEARIHERTAKGFRRRSVRHAGGVGSNIAAGTAPNTATTDLLASSSELSSEAFFLSDRNGTDQGHGLSHGSGAGQKTMDEAKLVTKIITDDRTDSNRYLTHEFSVRKRLPPKDSEFINGAVSLENDQAMQDSPTALKQTKIRKAETKGGTEDCAGGKNPTKTKPKPGRQDGRDFSLHKEPVDKTTPPSKKPQILNGGPTSPQTVETSSPKTPTRQSNELDRVVSGSTQRSISSQNSSRSPRSQKKPRKIEVRSAKKPRKLEVRSSSVTSSGHQRPP